MSREQTDSAPKTKRTKKAPIAIGVVVVLIAAGAGFFVWHEQPSFCNAICHTPMDSFVETYDSEPGSATVDKWGNEVENSNGMLSVVHKEEGYGCLDCHVPSMEEQIAEGLGWVTGNYSFPLEEKTLTDLVAARGLTNSEEFCLNPSCHDLTMDELESKYSDLEVNPHEFYHGDLECSDCHKAHRASVMVCSQCHTDAEIPEGWISYREDRLLKTSY